MSSDDIKVYYPNLMKVLVIVGLPILSITAIWLGLRPLLEADLTDVQKFLFPLTGIAVLYQCTIGFRCLKYLNAVLLLHDEGVDLDHKGKVTAYPWSELEVREYSFATTTQIKSKTGETIAYFSDGIPNLSLLVHTIKHGFEEE